MQSIQIAYEKSKSTAHKLGVENDTLKQQLKFLRERFAEIGDLKAEKETLEVALGESRKNLEASINHLQACKVDQRALQNNVTNMTRRLEEANVQKVDVLEQNGELQSHVSVLQKMLNALRTEAEELKKRPQMSEVEELKARLSRAEEENQLLAEQAKAAEGRADLPARVAELSFKLDDAKRNTAEKDKIITELQAQTSALTNELSTVQEERASLAEMHATLRTQTLQKQTQSNKRVTAMSNQIEEIEKARTAALAESEKHLQLLKETLRRTANDVHKREHPASNLLEKKLNIEEAIAEIRLKFERKKAKEAEQNAEKEEDEEKDLKTKIGELEKEIEYHVKDIVLYKLDVKGYRKDLKRAKEKIAILSDASTTSAKQLEHSEKEVVHTPKRQDSPTSPSQRSDSNSMSPATPNIATALQVQSPIRHIVSAYAAPMQVNAPMVTT
jgi:chromosome segregation ATPase